MRYFLCCNNVKEIEARIVYLQDIFKLYFTCCGKIGKFHVLEPIGNIVLPVAFVVGHDKDVNQFLKENLDYIYEESIVLVSCNIHKITNLKKTKKRVYYSKDIAGISYTYDGKLYGFDFDITESELDFYNYNTPDIYERLESNFKKMK